MLKYKISTIAFFIFLPIIAFANEYKIMFSNHKIDVPQAENKTFTSCNDILNNNKNDGNGIYTINPTGDKEFDVYCDMTSEGGGWTLVAAQFEQDSVPWNEGIQSDYDPTLNNSKSFALNNSEIPSHTQTSFGKSLDADAMDYFDYQYGSGNINKTTITGKQSQKDYHIHKHDSEYYSGHDPESSINQSSNPEWRNTLTVDALGGKKRNWAFAANQINNPDYAGYAYGGEHLVNTAQNYAWTVWVR